MNSRLFSTPALLALALAASSHGLFAAGMTAFDLVKEGDKVVPLEAKGKITQIRSEKSAGSLMPDVWHIDYYNPTAAFKALEVTFVAGKVTEITRPKHFLDAFSGNKQMEHRKLKTNSDRALAIALKEPALKGLHLRAAQFLLERSGTGPLWTLQFWAARKGDPAQTIPVGDLTISCLTGQIIKTRLHTQNAE